MAELARVVVLRGAGPLREMAIETSLDLPTGVPLILCGYWEPRMNLFWVRDAHAFVRHGQRWLRKGGPVGLPEVSITNAELTELIRQTSPSALANAADLVLVGRIDAISDSKEESDAYPHGTRRVDLTPETVFKGDRVVGTVSFVTQRWSSNEFKVGETWFAFLAFNGDGSYSPVDRTNGLLLVHGQELIYDRKVIYPYPRVSLTRTVTAAIAE